MTVGPKKKKGTLSATQVMPDAVSKQRLKELMDTVSLTNIPGMSSDMAASLEENGIRNALSVPSLDPLEIYDELKAAPKSSSTVEDNWKEIEYRHRVLNGLNLVTMHWRIFSYLNSPWMNDLCPINSSVNSKNGITRLTAIILVATGFKKSDRLRDYLSTKSALKFYQAATSLYNLNQEEGWEYYHSILNAKMIIDETYIEGIGPSNPRWPT